MNQAPQSQPTPTEGPPQPELGCGPVLLVIYRRPHLQQQVMKQITEANPSKLYVAADGPRDESELALTREARKLVDQLPTSFPVETNFSDTNLGCARRMKSAIDWFFEKEDSGIILEDDCLPHPDFFPYCRRLLDRYANDERVAAISGSNLVEGYVSDPETTYGFSSFFLCWGWATWRRAWSHFDWECSRFQTQLDPAALNQQLGSPNAMHYWSEKWKEVADGKLDSWALRFVQTCMIKGWLCVVPARNMVLNIGSGDAAATNSQEADLVALSAGWHGLGSDDGAPDQVERWIEFDHRTQERVFERKGVANRLKITLASTYQGGGAGIAANRLAEALQRGLSYADVEVRHATSLEAEGALFTNGIWREWFVRGLPSPVTPSFFSAPWVGETWKPELESVDLLHLHWIHDWLSLPMLSEQFSGRPVVLTLHDEGVFTGGCHYTGGCLGFTADCASCPQLHVSLHAIPPAVLLRRREWVEQIDPIIVTPSRWLAERASASQILRNQRIEVIPHGLDLNVWKPLEKQEARKALGLDPERDWILMVADRVDDPRKGMLAGLEAIRLVCDGWGCERPKPGLILIGAGQLELDHEILTVHMGIVKDQAKLRAAFSAASIFLHPAKEEAFGLVLIEAMACGTPVVAAAIGGIPEVLDERNRALLVEEPHADQFAEKLEMALDSPDLRAELAQSGLEAVKHRFNERVMVESYSQLYWEEIRRKPKKKASARPEELLAGIVVDQRLLEEIDDPAISHWLKCNLDRLLQMGRHQAEQKAYTNQLCEDKVASLELLGRAIQLLAAEAYWGCDSQRPGDVGRSVLAVPEVLDTVVQEHEKQKQAALVRSQRLDALEDTERNHEALLSRIHTLELELARFLRTLEGESYWGKSAVTPELELGQSVSACPANLGPLSRNLRQRLEEVEWHEQRAAQLPILEKEIASLRKQLPILEGKIATLRKQVIQVMSAFVETRRNWLQAVDETEGCASDLESTGEEVEPLLERMVLYLKDFSTRMNQDYTTIEQLTSHLASMKTHNEELHALMQDLISRRARLHGAFTSRMLKRLGLFSRLFPET